MDMVDRGEKEDFFSLKPSMGKKQGHFLPNQSFNAMFGYVKTKIPWLFLVNG